MGIKGLILNDGVFREGDLFLNADLIPTKNVMNEGIDQILRVGTHMKVCNNTIESGSESVYAAGNFSVQSYKGSEFQSSFSRSYRQGECAGINMAGSVSEYDCYKEVNRFKILGIDVAFGGIFPVSGVS